MSKKFIQLPAGLFLYAVGIVLSLNANLGVSPWDVLHTGISSSTNFTIGQVSIGVGLIIIIINYFLNVSIGIGTVLNMILIGLFVDGILYLDIIPVAKTNLIGVIMIIICLIIVSIATYLYIDSGYGAGPRDGLMIGLKKNSKLKIGTIRVMIEVSVLVLGYLLDGKVGIGTAIIAFGMGPTMQIVFNIFNFDAEKVKHKYFYKPKSLKHM